MTPSADPERDTVTSPIETTARVGDDPGAAGPGSEPVDGAEEPPQAGPLGLVALIVAFLALGLLSPAALVVVLALVMMIFMHELGHYLTAKRAGMKVTEFFIGFGPRIWSFRRGDTEYGVKLIWAGAYVKILGMNNLDEVDPADEGRTYRQKSYSQRLSVAVAGSTMHFLMAIVLLFMIFGLVGRSENQARENAVIGSLSTSDEIVASFEGLEFDDAFTAKLDAGETPASAAGLQPGDEVLAVDGEPVDAFEDLGPTFEDEGGATVELTYERDGQVRTTDLDVGTVSDGENEIGFIGVGPNVVTDRMSPWAAAGESASTFGEITGESAKALVRFFSPGGLSDFTDLAVNAGDDQPAAPVSLGDTDSADEGRIISIYGAARIGTQATQEGLAELFFFLVLINIFIGVFNLVPLLPLDGGHVAVATYERVREIGRPGRYHADVYKLIPLTYGVIFVLLTIGVLALYADIFDPVV
jgi:membrane-associated protease RseP (regulator of RpoE activity)